MRLEIYYNLYIAFEKLDLRLLSLNFKFVLSIFTCLFGKEHSLKVLCLHIIEYTLLILNQFSCMKNDLGQDLSTTTAI